MSIPFHHHDHIGKQVIKSGFYELDLLQHISKTCVQPNSIIVDIGANVGNHSFYWAKQHLDCQIVAFEPAAKNVELWRKNQKLLKATNTVLHDVGLGSSDTIMHVNYAGGTVNMGHTTLVESETQAKEQVNVRKLDNFGLVNVSVVKIDVEGMESSVLRGAIKTIQRSLPHLFVETRDSKSILKLLPHGYRIGRTFCATPTVQFIPPRCTQFERKIYSQNGEDGVLLNLLKIVGTTNKRSLEIGAHNGRQCNTRILRDNLKWKKVVQIDKEHENDNVLKKTVTATNVNQIVQETLGILNPDVFSLDINGIDFHVWQALLEGKFQPRIVCLEYNATLGLKDATVTNDDLFVWEQGSSYFGASLAALMYLGLQYNYTLIYVEKQGVNAFFLRNDVYEQHRVVFSHAGSIIHLYKKPRYNNGKGWVKPRKKHQNWTSAASLITHKW